jgi:hypothetical protein
MGNENTTPQNDQKTSTNSNSSNQATLYLYLSGLYNNNKKKEFLQQMIKNLQ